MNFFISQPMRGRTKEEIIKERENIIKTVNCAYPESKCVNVFHQNIVEENKRDWRLWYLGDAIKRMSEAEIFVDAACDYPREKYPGCYCELVVAESYKIPIFKWSNNGLEIPM